MIEARPSTAELAAHVSSPMLCAWSAAATPRTPSRVIHSKLIHASRRAWLAARSQALSPGADGCAIGSSTCVLMSHHHLGASSSTPRDLWLSRANDRRRRVLVNAMGLANLNVDKAGVRE